jgi:kynurenine formamidase
MPITSAGVPFSLHDFERLFDELKNWGRWGDDDELGTLNFLGPAEVIAACKLVTHGRRVSLSRRLDTSSGPDNQKPALHYMTRMAERSGSEPTFYTDFFGTDYHGKSVSHIDALCHVAYNGLLYNGRQGDETVNSTGSTFVPVSALANGVVGRGVLLDAPRARRVDWLEPPCALGAEDLDEIASTLGVEVRRGDVVLVRTGHVRRRQTLGPWDPDVSSAGLGVSSMRLLAGRQVALLGSDGDNDSHPSPVAGILHPIHILAMNAMGMCLLDNLDLEALSSACEQAGTFQFLLTVAPLTIPGGTGSPVNPIAVF